VRRPPQGAPGQIVILNGAPRSGKSSIVAAIQESFDDGPWMNLGVDVFVRHVTPRRYRPGMGLRPGEEDHPVAPLVRALYAALYGSIVAHSRVGLNVVVDVVHHDGAILAESARRLAGLPVLFVGVRCPIEVIMDRRDAGQVGRAGEYLTRSTAEPTPAPVLRWQRTVHLPGIYDLEVDTSLLSPAECAAAIRRRLEAGPPPSAFKRLAEGSGAQRAARRSPHDGQVMP
jgi:chloramphenicol 3-O phosphotransferase